MCEYPLTQCKKYGSKPDDLTDEPRYSDNQYKKGSSKPFTATAISETHALEILAKVTSPLKTSSSAIEGVAKALRDHCKAALKAAGHDNTYEVCIGQSTTQGNQWTQDATKLIAHFVAEKDEKSDKSCYYVDGVTGEFYELGIELDL